MDPTPPSFGLQFGDFTLIPAEGQLLKHGQPVLLTPKAFDLLVVLARNPGRLLTKEQLMQAVWGDTAVEDSNLPYHVSAIRKALGDTAENGRLIETVPKRGYRFTAPVMPLNGHIRDSLASIDDVDRQPNVPERAESIDAAPVQRSASGDRAMAEGHVRFRQRWRSVVWFAAGLLVASAVGVVVMRPGADQRVTRIQAEISPGVQLSDASPFALSPDGQKLVYVGTGQDGVNRLWLRRLEDEAARPLPGTETALGIVTPPMFWSPDSQSVAFDAAGQLKRVDLADGAVRTLCGLTELAVGGSWNADGIVIVGHPNRGLSRCSVADGRAVELTRLDAASGETAHVLPWFLPDGRHFLYVRIARSGPEGSGVYVGSLEDGPTAAKPARLLATGFGAAYIPVTRSSTGHLVFLRNANLFAQPFDQRTLQLRGDPVRIAADVGSFLDSGFFSVSRNDVIAFRAAGKDFQLTWFDRQGRMVSAASEVGRYSGVSLSADGARILTAKEIVGANIDQDIWILETARAARRATFGPLLEDRPVWSADGRRFIFTIGGDVGTLFEQVIDTAVPPRLLLETKQHKIPTSASRDGRFLLYTVENIDRSRGDVWVLPLLPEAKEFPLIQRNFDQNQGQFSPDQRWVAYVSNESGRPEVLVRRFIEPDEASRDPETVAVSAAGGTAPRWRADGKELYFLAPDGSVMAVDVHDRDALSVGTPRPLFRLGGPHGDWDVFPDGSRFLMAIRPGADASPPFTVLWNRLR